MGQLKNVELAYFDLNENKYLKKEFNEVFELLNASGNISFFGKEPVFHVHVTLAKKDFSVIGGHLNKAKVGATLEMVIQSGLKLLDFESASYEY